jgi:hypothetical protein
MIQVVRAAAGVVLLGVVLAGGFVIGAVNTITKETWPEF